MNRRLFFTQLASGLVAASSGLFLPKLINPAWKVPVKRPTRTYRVICANNGIVISTFINGRLVSQHITRVEWAVTSMGNRDWLNPIFSPTSSITSSSPIVTIASEGGFNQLIIQEPTT